MAREFDSTHEVKLFETQHMDGIEGANTGGKVFVTPTLEITAIGRQVAPASAADFKIKSFSQISSEISRRSLSVRVAVFIPLTGSL